MTSSSNGPNSSAPGTILQDVEVRAARAADLESAIVLLQQSNLPTQGVADHFEDGYAVVERGARVVAVAGIEIYGSDALLRSVAVAQSFRGHGLGETIVRDRLAWAREQGIRDVYLLTTTAREFFPRFGFERVDRAAAPSAMQASPEFAYICGSEATTMRVSIASGADSPRDVREQ